MVLNDKNNKVHGYFKIEVFDVNDNIKEVYEHHNMIMDKARVTLMNSASGFDNKFINKIVLGTQGHKTGDLTTPKTASDGFVSTRTQLFSEELSDFTYNINFTPTTPNDYATVVEDDAGAGSTVQINIADTTISYIIDVAGDAANHLSQVSYTEAALYTGTDIFAMRCFPVRIKDSQTKFRITWNITF
jgi:hypothetical protein